ncbi:flagellar basal body L-ring protein FlgH [Caulobacter sp. DWR1-3-2b1]|uniref:flagellar basal body L-ring protein FlgH n=1 Tax=Caulobacter sp. DWR1-3-2b1 TaxID=2804670 RepID=UPI003CFB3DA8
MTAMSRALAIAGLVLSLTAGSCSAVQARQARDWTALTADRVATRVGDSLTVIVQENASAANSAQSAARRNAQLGAQAARIGQAPDGGDLALRGQYQGDGSSGRSDRLAAQISVTVIEVLANGDLRVAGEQMMRVNGQNTRISVSGRARPADISGGNTILSTRLSDARIAYDGEGMVSRSARPGLAARLLSLF